MHISRHIAKVLNHLNCSSKICWFSMLLLWKRQSFSIHIWECQTSGSTRANIAVLWRPHLWDFTRAAEVCGHSGFVVFQKICIKVTEWPYSFSMPLMSHLQSLLVVLTFSTLKPKSFPSGFKQFSASALRQYQPKYTYSICSARGDK